nr:M23 family metallopeptidase [Smaragdicoccus niigatensis]
MRALRLVAVSHVTAVKFAQVRRNEVFIAIAAAGFVFAGADASHSSSLPGTADSQEIVVPSFQTKPVYSQAAHIEPLDLDHGVDIVLTPKPDSFSLDSISKGEHRREEQVVAAARRATLARAQREAAAAIAGEWQPWLGGGGSGGGGKVSSSGWIRPAEGVFTSGFGPRWGTFHAGIDIANAIGTPILAAANGTVIDAGPATGFGLWVRILHDDGSISVYGHLYDFFVSKGERVPAGMQIARMGNRGDSTGPHLHFEIIYQGVKVDPQKWMALHGVIIN